ncbi:hypothetical protein Catovirus_1_35 [Catovirus CTV1]|uniref:Uncharacterized protein n=1 Tax=Catovirus CTV1 TaxID=1977631 RepID=A0A1V0S8F3_9VIRU|nr:hypothetical protein Catovirus_1_35 [Catovirus CTV1]
MIFNGNTMTNILEKDFYEYCSRVIYNGPPRTLYEYYRYIIRNEDDLIDAIKFCDSDYIATKIINPSEKVMMELIKKNILTFHISKIQPKR